MKRLLTSLILFSTLSASADADPCAVMDARNILRLEQEVTLQGTVKENPMVADVADSEPAKATIIEFLYMLVPAVDVMLEQWLEDNTNFACHVEVVTLSLDKGQRDVVKRNLADGINSVTVTGKISWSESSVTGAGSAMLFNVSSVSK